ncbi:MAG: DUF1761 domain-containing protein [Bacteroidales bacterium]|nr:DUF1761 domain-containing protein [Bacteroidales bacterium]
MQIDILKHYIEDFNFGKKKSTLNFQYICLLCIPNQYFILMDLSALNYPAIIVAALSCFIIGGLWYSSILFGNAWMKENGFTKDKTRQGNMLKIFLGSFMLSLIIAFNLAAFIGTEGTLMFGLFAGFAAGAGWVATAFGIVFLFEQKTFRLFLIHAGYLIVTFTIMGGILGAWH